MKQAHPAAELFPLMGGNEFAALVEDIRTNGQHEPIWLDKAGRILDGRNRARACHELGIVPSQRVWDGVGSPIDFVVSLNLARRHLNPGQLAMLAIDIKQAKSEEAKKRQGRRTDLVADLPPSEDEETGKARDLAGATVGVPGRAVSRAETVTKQAPDLAAQVRAGTLALDRAERIIRDREAQQRKIAEALAEADAQPVSTDVDIRHGDFREVLADIEDVDAIITDPPYPAEFLPLLGDLAAWADKVLADDGVLAVLIGQTHLPDVYRLLDGHRPYRWTCCYLTEGNGYVSHPRKVQSNWKPLIVYGGGPRIADVVRSEGQNADAKGHHKWGQDYSAFHTLIERLTTRGQTVVDPFMGSGTTLLAAHALGRHAIGADIEAESVATARERLS